MEAEATSHDFQKLIEKMGQIQPFPEPVPVALFISKDISIEADDAPFPAISLDKVKAFIRKNPDLPEEQKSAIKELIKKLS